jgi:UDP-N-acetylmuramoyl-tripeptide--D-alanyl-D-alanine ligase
MLFPKKFLTKLQKRPLKFFAESCFGTLLNGAPSTEVPRVCTDSRQVRAGDLFLAIAGEQFDGHKFLQEAFTKGAVAVLIEAARKDGAPSNRPLILVHNTRTALGQIAAAYRKEFLIHAIAVGGSNGKTSTKELIAAVLQEKLQILKSEASFNNDIGVPLTLLNIEPSHQAGVFEAGTNHPGELEPLARMIQPEMAVITSIGREHLEHFENIEGVLKEEGVLGEVLDASGKLFLNGDAPESAALVFRTKAKVIKVGHGPSNQYRIANVRMSAGGTRFAVSTPDPVFSGEYEIGLLGEHQVLNAGYAIAVGSELGLSREEIARGLRACRPPKMRLEPKKIDDFMVLDDAYNANADSMSAALKTLGQFPCEGRRIAVLGDMAELGTATHEAHAEIGRRAALEGVNFLIATGDLGGTVAAAARSAGLQDVLEIGDVQEAAERLSGLVRSGDVVLVKASRASRLERVVSTLQEKFK